MEINIFQIIAYIALFIKLVTRSSLDEVSMFSYILYGIILVFGLIGIVIYVRKNRIKKNDIFTQGNIAHFGILGFIIYLIVRLVFFT